MITFTYRCEVSGVTIKATTPEKAWADIAQTFYQFLLGCGYQIDPADFRLDSRDETENNDIGGDEELRIKF